MLFYSHFLLGNCEPTIFVCSLFKLRDANNSRFAIQNVFVSRAFPRAKLSIQYIFVTYYLVVKQQRMATKKKQKNRLSAGNRKTEMFPTTAFVWLVFLRYSYVGISIYERKIVSSQNFEVWKTPFRLRRNGVFFTNELMTHGLKLPVI